MPAHILSDGHTVTVWAEKPGGVQPSGRLEQLLSASQLGRQGNQDLRPKHRWMS